ncbi:MAG TPA: FAD-binding domain-containing protein [Candidatus Cybelea sp.]|jgi:deoxyribodipyrimidine photo-lyase|nr:FAD-binding domain-containing protein [Candidatus Cybelea sp.]
MAQRPYVYRFSTDLRLDDHAGLAAAAARGEVLPVLVLDGALQARLRRSPRRAAFFCGAVEALDAELQERGSRLTSLRGPAAGSLIALAREVDAAGIAWSAAYDGDGAAEDRRLQSDLEEAGLEAMLVHDAPAIAPEAIATAHGDGYRAFAPFFDRWWSLAVASHEQPLLLQFLARRGDATPLPRPQDFGSSQQVADAGSARARALFERFLRDDVTRYQEAAAIPAADATSQLGAHLSFGTISARTIARRCRERMGDPFALAEERASLKLFLRSLARRDFFLQLSWFHPETQNEALQEKMRGFVWASNHPALTRWIEGRTGHPLVDAGVRQLQQTGWMHPYVRAVAASVLCYDLGVDWRVGREQWERLLVEDDPAVATGNWQWIAAVGADMAQYPRIYNPERQRRRCDPAGTYVRRWIPQLRAVPAEAWYGRSDETPQLELALFGADAYPAPAVEHADAARDFLARYREFVSP